MSRSSGAGASRPPVTAAPQAEPFLSADALAAAVGIDPHVLEGLIRLGLVEPSAPGGGEFNAAEVRRLRRMLRLHDDLGVHFLDAAIIVDLLERIDRMEAEVIRLRAASAK